MVNPVPGYGIGARFKQTGRYWTACGWHTGLDLLGIYGATIVAPIAGTIRHRNYGPAFGPYQFAISPSAGQPFATEEAFFGHVLSRLPDGTEVKAGQPISKVGALGNVDGPHLHLERHSRKQVWSCEVMLDPMPYITWQPPTTWKFPAGTKVFLSYLKVGGEKANADGWSQSIMCLEEMLNKHTLEGGQTLTVDGKYDAVHDDEEVRLCQDQHDFGADPVGKSFVGPKQLQHIIDTTGAPYVMVDDRDTAPTPPSPTEPTQPTVKPWLAKGAVALRSEVDVLWPNRDKATDGWIGDLAHCGPNAPPSEHCASPTSEPPGAVRAIDIDTDLQAGDPEASQRLADSLVEMGRTRRDRGRLYYVIHNGRIASGTYPDTFWTWRPYTGSNPHTSHVHVSFHPAADQDGSTWNLADAVNPPVVPVIERAEFDALVARVERLEDMGERLAALERLVGNMRTNLAEAGREV